MNYPFIPIYVKDILVDTVSLSDAEFTVYHKLLYAMWLHGGSVIDDDAANARLTGRTVTKYRNIKAALMPMLSYTDDGKLTQKRLKIEYENAQNLSAKQSANSKARWNKNKDLDDAVGKPRDMPTRAGAVTVHNTHKSSSLCSDDSAAKAAPTAKTELANVLDDTHVKAVIDHRAKIRKPLTAHAAHLLAGKFAQCPDPNAAADTMVANGWQGFEPDWLVTRSTARAPPPQQQQSMLDYLKEETRRLKDEEDARTIEGDYRHGHHNSAN